MNVVILPKARRSRKRKPDPAFAKRHVIDTLLPSSPQPQRKAKSGKARKPKAAINVRTAVTVGQTGKSLDEWLQQPSAAQTNCPPPTGWTHIPQIDDAVVRVSFDEWRKGKGLGCRLQAEKHLPRDFHTADSIWLARVTTQSLPTPKEDTATRGISC